MRKFFVLLLLASTPAWAGSAGNFAGTYIIASAKTAPWDDPKNPMPDNGERASLVGKTVTIGAKAISGPKQIACPDPHYAVKQYPPDMLFQGSLPHPATDAPALGFKGKTSPALETGCEIEIDWHMADDGSVEFGLNDVVYILKKK